MAAGGLGPVAAHLSLSAVSLFSAVRTLQAHRGAAAGFLLQAVAAALMAVGGSSSELSTDSSWVGGVLGPPLLAFSFFWIHGDHLTANLLLLGALLLASCSGSLSPDTKQIAACLTNGGSALGILVLSIFTGSGYGVLGSLALATGGAVTCLATGGALEIYPEVAASCMYSASFLALHTALRTAGSDLS